MQDRTAGYKSYGEPVKTGKTNHIPVSNKPIDNWITKQDGANPGKNVIDTGYKIVVQDRKIITGSCGDFVNAIFNAAGYSEGKRYFVFKSKIEGPYADANLLEPGDWVMHRNIEYGNIEHNSIFIKWTNKEKNIAMTLDYVGRGKYVMGKYSEHDLSKVFCIVRALNLKKYRLF